MRKYHVWYWANKVEAVEVERETECMVFINGRRRGKEDFYDTYESARSSLIRKRNQEVESAMERLKHCEAKLKEALKLNPNHERLPGQRTNPDEVL